MNIKSIIIAAIALTGFVGNATADTSKLLAADGWTKITTLPTSTDIANNYYVFVDNTRDLMLGVGKGVNQNTKWYSLGVYYYTSVEPTSASINNMTWTLESQGSGFAMRNLEYSVSPFQTEWNAAWKFDTNDVYATANEWCEVLLSYNDGAWTIQNGRYPSSGYIGPWTNGNFTNGAECAGNKTDDNIGKFQIYTISRTQFKQNLLDNASESNPVDLTPWYVTNATFDANNGDGWEATYSANSSGWWGSHAFSNLGSENYQQVAEVKQTLTLPNGTYKVSLQGATNKVSDNLAYVFATHNGNTVKTFFTKETVSTIDEKTWNDMQYNLLLMMQDRNYGRVSTSEIEVTTGSLTIGYANESGHSWDVFDNFKLYCTGLDLSAYEAQLADLVSEANAFIATNVVPDACEAIISDAISTYNKSYSTAKEYSVAIIALANVLDTYRNDSELQTAYSSFYTLKSKVEGLKTGVDDGATKTTLTNAIAAATTDTESATTTAAINTQKANLRAAALTFISNTDGQFDITFLASRQSSDWKKKDGSAAGEVTWAVSNRGEWTFAESYEGTCETTGTVLYQTISDLPAGYYQVGMYAMAAYTPDRGFATQATEGDANRSFAFAGNLDDASSILRTGIAIPFKTSFDFSELTTLDVNVHLSATGDLTFGVQKDMNGSNWHFAQIASIVYSNQPDLTNLIATRNALVAQAEGLLSGSAAYLTAAQQSALQDAIDAGNAASTFDDLNTVTLTTLPDAINVANQQVQLVKDNRVLMLAALERFENDYNLSDGTDYSRQTMSASAWTSLIEKVNAVSTALDDVSQATSYGTIKDALVAQMDATDQSLRLFKSYKAMVEGVSGVLGSSAAEPYAAASNMDTDATQQTAIAALNAAFVDYANNQDASFDVSAFLGANLDFSAAEGAALNTANSNNIHAVEGWDVDYADADTWATLQTHQSANDGKLYIRKNWGSAAATLTVTKQKMLPVGRYRLSIEWNSTLANMTNLSAFTLDGASTAIGKATTGAETLTYEFEVSDAATPCDIIIGFKKQNTGDAAAQIVADNITLTYLTNVVTLGNTTDNTATIDAANGQKANVVLDGRTLYKDGSWNTLCLPFNLDIAGSLLDGDGVTLMTLDGTTSNYSAGTLTLNFTTADAIQAGKPYIIKWNNTGADIVNPRFIGVTLDATSPAAVSTSDNAAQFVATYSPVDIDALGDNTKLYISTGNNIYWPNAAMTIGSQRAYFQLQGTLTAGDADTSAGIRAINLNFDGTETLTAIDAVENGKSANGKSIYNLNGQQLSAPQRGINIVDGKKVFVK